VLHVLFLSPPAKTDKSGQDLEHLDFKIVVEPKDLQSFTVILVASSRQEKSAWTSDISQACQHTSHPPQTRTRAG
jgi:Ras-specific guanine nucleotide-releasing factor 1